jgi:hypothetical protein
MGKNSRITTSHFLLKSRFQKRFQRAFTPDLPSVIAVITNPAIVGPYGANKIITMVGTADLMSTWDVPAPAGILRMSKMKSPHQNQVHPKAIRKKNVKFRSSNAFALNPTT